MSAVFGLFILAVIFLIAAILVALFVPKEENYRNPLFWILMILAGATTVFAAQQKYMN